MNIPPYYIHQYSTCFSFTVIHYLFTTHQHIHRHNLTQQHNNIFIFDHYFYLLTIIPHTHTHHNKTTLLSFSIVLFGHHSFINALSYNSYTFIHSPIHNTSTHTHKHHHNTTSLFYYFHTLSYV